MRKPAYTLLEVLVTISIIGVLIALVASGVQKARMMSSRMASQNNLKQIGLGLQQFHDMKGRFPGVNDVMKNTPIRPEFLTQANAEDPNADISPLVAILPFVDGATTANALVLAHRKLYVSPSDPTIDLTKNPLPSSYCVNIYALETRPSIASGFPDGVTNTIAATEKYSVCYTNNYQISSNVRQQTNVEYGENMPGSIEYNPRRRPTFADRSFPNEIYPVRAGTLTFPSLPGQTFQVRPKPSSAWCSVPQTPFDSGLPTLMFDGSVRTIYQGIDENVFWGAVTRNGGEVLADF